MSTGGFFCGAEFFMGSPGGFRGCSMIQQTLLITGNIRLDEEDDVDTFFDNFEPVRFVDGDGLNVHLLAVDQSNGDRFLRYNGSQPVEIKPEFRTPSLPEGPISGNIWALNSQNQVRWTADAGLTRFANCLIHQQKLLIEEWDSQAADWGIKVLDLGDGATQTLAWPYVRSFFVASRRDDAIFILDRSNGDNDPRLIKRNFAGDVAWTLNSSSGQIDFLNDAQLGGDEHNCLVYKYVSELPPSWPADQVFVGDHTPPSGTVPGRVVIRALDTRTGLDTGINWTVDAPWLLAEVLGPQDGFDPPRYTYTPANYASARVFTDPVRGGFFLQINARTNYQGGVGSGGVPFQAYQSHYQHLRANPDGTWDQVMFGQVIEGNLASGFVAFSADEFNFRFGPSIELPFYIDSSGSDRRIFRFDGVQTAPGEDQIPGLELENTVVFPDEGYFQKLANRFEFVDGVIPLPCPEDDP